MEVPELSGHPYDGSYSSLLSIRKLKVFCHYLCLSLDCCDPFWALWPGLTNEQSVVTRGFDISRTEAWLTLVGSETLDSKLGIFIPKKVLDIATADECSKQNCIKTTDKDTKHKSDTNKTQRTKKHNKNTKLRPQREILGNRFSHIVQLVVNH